MPITYGGVPLVCEDPGGTLQGWLDQYLALEELRDQTGTTSLTSNRADSRSGYRTKVSLPRPNYPPKDRAKLFTLYWPTGAARWSTFYALATANQYAEIANQFQAASGNTALALRFFDGSTTMSTQMYCLPPRKITAAIPAEPAQALWMLPLVDARYYWQLVDASQFRYGQNHEFTSWKDIFSLFSGRLGVSVASDNISANYDIPDPDELTRSYENIAVLMDAVSHSVGQRIVRQIDGTVKSVGYATSDSTLAANKYLGSVILGGDSSTTNAEALIPAKIKIVFPKWYYGAPDPYGGLFEVNRQASNYTNTTPIANSTKTIHTTAFADFSTGSAGADNLTEVNALADQIATDFYGYLDGRYDVSYQGIVPWTLSGYDDCVEWCFGRKADRPDYQAFTRARSMPYNFGVEEQLSQFADTPVYPSLTRFELDSVLNPGGNAMGFHVAQNGGGYFPTPDKIKVYDFGNRFAAIDVTANIQGWAQFRGDSLRWEIVELMQKARFIHFTLTADLTETTPAGNNATVNEYWDGVDPSASVKVFLPPSTTAGLTVANGKKGTAVYNDRLDRYYAIDWDC